MPVHSTTRSRLRLEFRPLRETHESRVLRRPFPIHPGKWGPSRLSSAFCTARCRLRLGLQGSACAIGWAVTSCGAPRRGKRAARRLNRASEHCPAHAHWVNSGSGCVREVKGDVGERPSDDTEPVLPTYVRWNRNGDREGNTYKPALVVPKGICGACLPLSQLQSRPGSVGTVQWEPTWSMGWAGRTDSSGSQPSSCRAPLVQVLTLW